MILAIDTSTASASVALYDGEIVLSEVTWQTAASATVQLLPVVQQCFYLAQGKPADLTGIAVALGPGSFNGLRVGLSLGKGLAYSLRRPIVGMATPDIAAYPFSALLWPVCAILRAGRGRVIRALFQTRYGRWQRIGDFSNTTLKAICQETERSTVFCGEIDSQMSAYIREQLGQRALVSSAALSARRAGYLAEMAWKRLQDDPAGDELASLQPIYLTRPRIGAPASPEEEEA
jgi:tRNA threonylcarbamoyladenosine biosynthesis protein TsaB